jgi:hypothetical protein
MLRGTSLAIEIELPDGTILEAPDGADASAVAKAYLAKQSSPPVSANDRALAATSGAYSGIANTAGLPVDTALNVWDLAKAGVGTVQGMTTGRAPSPIFDPTNRTDVVGSSDWIKKLMNKAGAVTQAPRPDDRASRYLNTAANVGTGMYLGSALPSPKPIPNPAPTNVPPVTGFGGNAASNANAGANLNIGAGQAAAQSTVSGGATATGRGGGFNFGTVGDDAASGLTAGQQSAAAGGQRLGMRLTPGQATGNKLLQRLEAKLESQPMTAGPFDRIKDTNARAVNSAAARAIGETSDNLNSGVLNNAVERIGKVFDEVRDEAPRTIDPDDFLTKVSAISDEFEAIGPQLTNHPLSQRLLKHAENGSATGKDLGALSSKLTREAHRQMTSPNGDRELGAALYKLKDYTDDLVSQGLSGDRLAKYNQARGEYRNLMLMTSRVGAINPSTGNVNGSIMANVLQQKDKAGFLFGRNSSDMYDAARFAQAFRPIVGDSGTATRMPLPSPTDFVLSLPFNLATRAYTSSPAVQAAIRAQAASQATANAMGPAARGLVAPAASPGGLLGAASAADDPLWNR